MRYLKEGIFIFVNAVVFYLSFFFLNRLIEGLETNTPIGIPSLIFLITSMVALVFLFVTTIILERKFLYLNTALTFIITSAALVAQIPLDYEKFLLCLLAALLSIIAFELRARSFTNKLVSLDFGIVYYFSQLFLTAFLLILFGAFAYFKIESFNEQQKNNIILSLKENVDTVLLQSVKITFGINAADPYPQAARQLFQKLYHAELAPEQTESLRASIETEFGITIAQTDTLRTIVDRATDQVLVNQRKKFLNTLSTSITFILIAVLLSLKPITKYGEIFLIHIVFWVLRVTKIIHVNPVQTKQEIITL